MELSVNETKLFHDILRREMRRRGIKTNREYAALLKITPQYMGEILSDIKSGARQLLNFADRLGVPAGYLLGREQLPACLPVPLVTERIAASPGGLIPGVAVEQTLYFPIDQLHGRRRLAAVQLGPKADSMLPTIRPGDIVVIDLDDRHQPNRGFYAVRLPDRESCAVKRLQSVPDGRHVLLISDNPAYEPLSLEWREDLIIGKVIFSLTCWLP